MYAYFHLLIGITLPIILICACGIWLEQRRSVDTKLLADISLYILAPALILSALTGSRLRGENVLSVLYFTVIMTALCWGLAAVAGKLARFSEGTTRALTLTTLFSNSNNYGLPVLLLAFGHPGFVLGTIYVVGQIILVNVLGMYIASRENMNGKQALKNIFQSPLIYAALIGIVLSLLYLRLPLGINSAVQLLGHAYPVLVLLILGIQLRRTSFSGLRRLDVWLGVFLRLLIVPVLAKLVLVVLGIHGTLASVLFVEASMPAAINTVTLVEKFDGDKQLVSLIVSITTVLSFIYLPALIYIG
ncbi:AEC family transporter [Sporolactobacillus sp. THM7-7]|nr:AEC family transporter [Sporolactobacillus sp. THM7-7]